MNAAFLLMSFVAGADAPAVPAAHVSPCCAIPAPCSDACARRGLFAHLNLGACHKHDCNPCGHCTHNVFHGFTTAAPCNTCDPCGIERHGWGSGPGLLTRLKAKFGHKDCCDAPCGVPGGCALPPIPGAAPPAVPPATPEKMPAPDKIPSKDPKGSARVAPGLSPVAVGGSPF